jgi:uncharacterized protein YdhG (YjbR/CyaY superfamily)
MNTITEYIDTAPFAVQEKLHQLHECIRAAAPGAVEGLKWNMPAYSYQRILVTFKFFKHHIGFYPTPSTLAAFAPKLLKYKTGNGSIQFPLNQPLPIDLIRKIVLYRVKESKEEDVKWRS